MLTNGIVINYPGVQVQKELAGKVVGDKLYFYHDLYFVQMGFKLEHTPTGAVALDDHPLAKEIKLLQEDVAEELHAARYGTLELAAIVADGNHGGRVFYFRNKDYNGQLIQARIYDDKDFQKNRNPIKRGFENYPLQSSIDNNDLGYLAEELVRRLGSNCFAKETGKNCFGTDRPHYLFGPNLNVALVNASIVYDIFKIHRR